MNASNSFNLSDRCEFISGLKFSTWLTVLQITFLMPSLLASLILNASFTIVVIIHKALHQKDEVMNLVLTVSNICYSIVRCIFYTVAVINGEWPLGKPSCYVVGTIMFFLAILRFTFVLAFSVDRFGTVVFPFKYSPHSTMVAAVIFTVGSVYGVVTSVVFCTRVFGCYNLDGFDYVCIFQVHCSEINCFVYIVLNILILITSGILLPLVFNVIVFYRAKKLRTTLACGTIGNVEMSGSCEASTRNQDTKAMTTIALLLASVIGLTLPYTTFVSAKGILDFTVAAGSPIALLGILLSDLHVLVPIADGLVVWRNTKVKTCAKSLYQRACLKTEN